MSVTDELANLTTSNYTTQASTERHFRSWPVKWTWIDGLRLYEVVVSTGIDAFDALRPEAFELEPAS